MISQSSLDPFLKPNRHITPYNRTGSTRVSEDGLLDPNFRRPSVLARLEGDPDCLVHFNRSTVFIAMDTEGVHEKSEPGKPRYSSYGFTVPDMSEVSCIAPGAGAQNW